MGSGTVFRRLVALGAIAVVGVAGCAAPGSVGARTSGTVAPADLPAALAGRTFLSPAVTRPDAANGSKITVEFRDDGSVGAYAGCNHMGGAASWNGSQFAIRDMYMTEMACDQGLTALETWFGRQLSAGVQVSLDGNELTMKTDDVTLVLTDRKVADPDRPLVGTTWIMTGEIHGSGDSGSISHEVDGPVVTVRVAGSHLDVFNGLTWLRAPLASGQDLGGNSGTARVAGDLTGNAIGCEGGGTACFVDVSVFGSDFGYQITAGDLTVTGIGPTAGRGLTFHAEASGFSAADLIGHTYRLTRLFTDAGGVDTKYPDARFTIRFANADATAESNCGTITYPHVRYYRSGGSLTMVDIGEPEGPACSLGSDPSGVPSGKLMAGLEDGKYFLSTGFVGWYFEPAS